MSDSSHFIDFTSQVHELQSGSDSCTATCLGSAKRGGSPAALATQMRANRPRNAPRCTILYRVYATNDTSVRHLTVRVPVHVTAMPLGQRADVVPFGQRHSRGLFCRAGGLKITWKCEKRCQ